MCWYHFFSPLFDVPQIALESVCVIDNGETMLVEGLRVAPQERGKGVAGVLLRFCSELVKSKYPEVKVTRLTRDDQLGPKDFQKYRIITKQVPATNAACLTKYCHHFFVSLHDFLLFRVFFWYASGLRTLNYVCLSLVWMETYTPLCLPPSPILLQCVWITQLSISCILPLT